MTAIHCAVLLLWGASLPLQAAAGDPIEDLMASTCRIKIKGSSSTGFLVSKGGEGKPSLFLVTAAHVFDEKAETLCTLVLRGRTDDRSWVRKEVKVSFRDGEAALFRRHADLDVAVLPVTLPAGVVMKPLEFRQLAEASWGEDRRIKAGQEVFMPCFPAGVEGNAAGWPLLRKGSIATHPLAPLKEARSILLDIPVFGGESGAPVAWCGGESPVVIGIQVGMHRRTDKSSSPFEEKTQHMPLGVGIVVQSPFIRDTIDLFAK